MIDGELMRIVPSLDRDGMLKRDDTDRPKLKKRLPDLHISGFHGIINRHGMKSLDAQELHNVFGKYRQEMFAWSDDLAKQDEPEDRNVAIAIRTPARDAS